MKKRIQALLFLMALMCTVLTGCGGGSTAAGSQDAAQSGTPDSGRAETNEIAVGIAQDLDDSLDHHKGVAAGTKEVMFNVFEGLMKPTSSGDLIPAVADHYEISGD